MIYSSVVIQYVPFEILSVNGIPIIYFVHVLSYHIIRLIIIISYILKSSNFIQYIQLLATLTNLHFHA